MAQTRYRESRTLVRGIRRLPKEDRNEYKSKVARLRAHFERFNNDVAEICQWLMGLRPGGKHFGEETRPFWDYFLEPSVTDKNLDETKCDGMRLVLFNYITGMGAPKSLEELGLDPSLRDSVSLVVEAPLTPTTVKLFERLRGLGDAHRLVLLKAAAEWIVSRYQRGYDNYVRQREVWGQEKSDWESRHPKLTPVIRKRFNQIFKDLGVSKKRPRVCAWEKLQTLRDDCDYAGEKIRKKNHSPLCKRYSEFIAQSEGKERGNIKKYFAQNAEDYLRLRSRKLGQKRDAVLAEFVAKDKKRAWFPSAWERYIKTVKVHEDNLINKYACKLPHCLKFDDDCHWNPHTDDCKNYRCLLKKLPKHIRDLEPRYREWRKDFLSGPRKPSFRYPSSRLLPMPKIFGKDFFTVDFDNSTVGLRLDDMPRGEFLTFAFVPWPKEYTPRWQDATITSVHVNFSGVKPRIGFRFDVHHKPSRFEMTQDDIDSLRSRVYPRKSQDAEFLRDAREKLLASFNGCQDDIRILAVDLGRTGACAAVFHGRKFQKAVPLKIIKVGTLKASYKDDKDNADKPSAASPNPGPGKRPGLSGDHVGLHVKGVESVAGEIANKRNLLRKGGKLGPSSAKTEPPPTLGRHDLRGLSTHIRRMIRDWVRLNASQIILLAEQESVDLIVCESLRGFLPPGSDQLDPGLMDKKRWLAFFSYGRIRRKVTEKAVERGMRVLTEPYFLSSQTCCACGRQQHDDDRWKKNKKSGRFICEYNGCHNHSDKGINADENAARVLGRVFWGEITLPNWK